MSINNTVTLQSVKKMFKFRFESDVASKNFQIKFQVKLETVMIS